MSDGEEDARAAAQARALDVYKPTDGAVISPLYATRRQTFYPVNMHDLKNIVEFDLLETGAGAAGMFFVTGPFWLLFEKQLEGLPFTNPVIWVSALSVIFGLVLIAIACRMRKMKKSRIDEIIEETGRAAPSNR